MPFARHRNPPSVPASPARSASRQGQGGSLQEAPAGTPQASEREAGAGAVSGQAILPAGRSRPLVTPVQRAVGLLRRREHSRVELERKLRARGIEDSQARQAVTRVAEAGWQDDARFAEMLVRTRAAAGYGPRYITAELATHAIEGPVAEAAFTLAGGGQPPDWAANAAELLARRFDCTALGDERTRRKAMALLVRRGFAPDHGHAALAIAAGES